MTNEELDKIVEEAVENNVIIYAEDKLLLIDRMWANLFRIGQASQYKQSATFGIEYVITDDFKHFKDEYLELFERIQLSHEQKGRVLDKFKSLGATWPGEYDDSPYQEWFFIFKASWGRHYFAAIRKPYKTGV